MPPLAKKISFGKNGKTWFGPLRVSISGQRKFGLLFEILNTAVVIIHVWPDELFQSLSTNSENETNSMSRAKFD